MRLFTVFFKLSFAILSENSVQLTDERSLRPISFISIKRSLQKLLWQKARSMA
ncbi:MAG: hypothetical protein F6K17_11965 [Okeania sp. SIO3C4]|nr:hypothetical protein [Okeania sp. SIO3B3]NER03278.1 hypothetical protein [Okeania sp. SIO3C4]